MVLDDIAARSIEQIICLGDLVEGGEENEAVVALMRRHPIEVIRGNHDDIHDCPLSPDAARWLTDRPDTLIADELLFTHITPRRKQHAIRDRTEAWNVFDETEYRRCFIGHLHYPVLYGEASEDICEARAYPVDSGIVPLDPLDRYIICFGAIGYPRAGGRFIRYGIFDDQEETVEFIKLAGPVLPYGI